MDIKELLQDVGTVQDSDIQRISRIATNIVQEQFVIQALEDDVKARKAKLFELQTVELPEAMDMAGIAEFTTSDGAKVKVAPVVQGSLPKEYSKRSAALDWLRANGHEGLIKREISVAFGKGQDDVASLLVDKINELLQSEEVDAPVEDNPSVHPQTLCAWAREMIAEQTPFPADSLGLWIGRKAIVK
jgi:hypothetical protein